MPFQAGARLGPYELLAPLGAGGMGEVVRARDTRLDRAVALKLLPAEFARDPDRRRRFEREARAVASLSHPHICALFDVGREDGVDFLVMEHLEGRTLAERLEEGALPVEQVLRFGEEIASALEEAHRHGIVHRDLKPANVMLTPGGVKLLDFGVAKLRERERAGGDETTRTDVAAAPLTGENETLGTLPYMAPEQLEGEPADERTDLFALGVVLYEAATGRRAFTGKSRASVAAAILHGEPPPMASLRPLTPPALERMVRTCLAKDPADRWQTAREARLALRWILDGDAGPGPAPARARRSAWTGRLAAVAAAVLVVGGILGWAVARLAPAEPDVVFRRITFQRGNVLHGRFARDSETVIYGAAWQGRPAEVFLARADGTGARPLALPSADIQAISPAGEMAVLLKRESQTTPTGGGMLAVVPLTGGAPREILDGVLRADWGPGGEELAVVRELDGLYRIEYPIHHDLYRTPRWIRGMRVSPDGAWVAFAEITRGLAASLKVVDRRGEVRTLAEDWCGMLRPAWRGGEIVFGGGPTCAERAIRAVTPQGAMRALYPFTGSNLIVHDVAPDGRLLVESDSNWSGLVARGAGAASESDLSWLGGAVVRDLSADGSAVLYSEAGEGASRAGEVYLRRLDGSPAVRLGEGSALALSPDGRWALSVAPPERQGLELQPIGAGESLRLPTGGVAPLADAVFLADGRRIVFAGSEGDRPPRLWIAETGRFAPRALTPEGVALGLAASPDGREVAANGFGDGGGIYPVDGGEPRPVPGLLPGDVPIQWSADGADLFLFRRGELPAPIVRLEIASGRRRDWRTLAPTAPGVIRIHAARISRDGLAYAYSYDSVRLSDLYVVELDRKRRNG